MIEFLSLKMGHFYHKLDSQWTRLGLRICSKNFSEIYLDDRSLYVKKDTIVNNLKENLVGSKSESFYCRFLSESILKISLKF